MIGVDRMSKGIREKRMNRMECVRMNMEEDNGRKVRRSSKRSRMRIERSMGTKRRIECKERLESKSGL